ncbi:histidine kinase, partial [Streptomyces sp. SID12501]|nr:histidine kinase [Streptomyces sp. SID12501]
MREVTASPPVAGAPFQRGVLVDSLPTQTPLTGDALTDLLSAILAVAGQLDLTTVLDRFVQVSAELTGARYGAINVLDDQGASTTFVYTGIPTAVARMLRRPPPAEGVLGQIPVDGALRLDYLT